MRNAIFPTLVLGIMLGSGVAIADDTTTTESHSVTSQDSRSYPATPAVSAKSRTTHETKTHDGKTEQKSTEESVTNDGETEKHQMRKETTTTHE